MRIVIAPNAFKGSMTAREAAEAIARGVTAACPEAELALVPVADGGDGLAEVLLDALKGRQRSAIVHGPLGEKIAARFCHIPDRKAAVVEMAAASGLALLPEHRRDPMRATTYGTGELIAAALALNVQRVIVGIGGSATNDCGIGAASALGMKFLDEHGNSVPSCGGCLAEIRHIELSQMDPRLGDVVFEVICDVDNSLLGERGASRVYAPQKGATPEQVEELEVGMYSFADVVETEMGIDLRSVPGGGAAGGLGAGLVAFFGAKLRPGIDVVLEMVELDRHLERADLVITAEGQVDYQTAFGKAPAGVARMAKDHGVPCFAVCGGIGDRIGELHGVGINAVFSICPGPVSLEEAMSRGAVYLAQASEQAVRAFLAS